MKDFLNTTSTYCVDNQALFNNFTWLTLAQTMLDNRVVLYCSAGLLFQATKFLQESLWEKCPSFLGFRDGLNYENYSENSNTFLSLQEAVSYGDCAGVEKILLNNSWCEDNDTGEKALTIAASNGYLDILQLLLSFGIRDSHADEYNALIAATDSGRVEIVQFLIDHTKLYQRSHYQRALEAAAFRGYPQIIELILSRCSFAHLNLANAILPAAREKKLKSLNILLRFGIDISNLPVLVAAFSQQSYRPIQADEVPGGRVVNDHFDRKEGTGYIGAILTILLKNGANPNEAAGMALSYAAQFNDDYTCKLISKGANPNLMPYGIPALMTAAGHANEAAFNCIFPYINETALAAKEPCTGMTTLHYAAKWPGYQPVHGKHPVYSIVTRMPDLLDQRNNQGMTALIRMVAGAGAFQLRSVILLLKFGADYTITDNDGNDFLGHYYSESSQLMRDRFSTFVNASINQVHYDKYHRTFFYKSSCMVFKETYNDGYAEHIRKGKKRYDFFDSGNSPFTRKELLDKTEECIMKPINSVWPVKL